MGNKISHIFLFVLLGNIYCYAQQKISLPDSLKFDFLNTVGKGKVKNLNNISHFFSDLNPDSALHYGNLAAKEAQNIGYEEGLVIAYNLTGYAHYNLGNIDNSMGDLFKAVKIARKNNLKALEGETLIKVGALYSSLGQWDKHYKYTLKASEIFEEVGDKSWIGFAHNNLGISYRHMKEFDLAMESYSKGLKAAKETNNLTAIVRAYGNMANIFSERNETDSAIYYMQIALDIEMNSKDTVNISQKTTLFTNMGSLYMSLDSLKKAEEYFMRALKIAEKTNNIYGTGSAERYLGEIEFKKGNNAKALALAKSATKKAEEFEDYTMLSKIAMLQHTIFDSLQTYDSSLFYLKKYNVYEDTIEKRANASEQANMRWSNLIEKKEAEISSLEQQQQILQEKQYAELKAKRLLWVALAISLLGVILLYISIRGKIKVNQKNKQIIKQEREVFQLEKEKAEQELLAKEKLNKLQQEKHEMELNLKNKELATLTMQMLNKSESISTLKERVDELKKAASSTNGEFSKQIKQLSSGINDSINLEKDWESFKMHFEEVNKGFFQKLKVNHPSLTSNDLRVCSYLYIHLDTKQIARLLSISPDAVKKKRYRLRKKMDLVQKEDIAAHIGKITA